MNHLQYEKSPYLLQHKNNPVDWFAWKEEAFEKAKREDKPIFLSIGYSTCHWCHVMEGESFEDEEVAEILNRGFIAIKVDREERPDIDSVYMGVCQMMTGSGGWPLTILMTPEQKPFFAGTYFPKWSKYGMPGLMELLAQVEKLWKTDREKLLETGEKITDFLQKEPMVLQAMPTPELLKQGTAELMQRFDREWGGFGVAPKFPTPHNLLFLLRYGRAERNEIALSAVEKTLDAMAMGGMFDHIGGGFSRYSTDEKWLVPHFEKMLYDNALLAYTYLEGYRQTGRSFYRIVAEKTLDYVLRELTHEEGGFFCGQDADSEGIEGKYYVFTPTELRPILEGDTEVFCSYFHIIEEGNFHGKSIPNRLREELPAERNEKIDGLCRKVYEYRKQRTFLHLDDKILTAWNGLMIGAFAKAGFLLENAAYLAAAQKAADFIDGKLTDEKGRLYLRYRDGDAAHKGQLDDYAFYAFGLLELYAATFDLHYLERAVQLAEMMLEWFGGEQGGLYLYAKDGEQLIQRPKETYDGALPSGNSAAGYVFAKLAALTGEPKWREERDKQLSFLAGAMEGMPSGHCFGLFAMGEVLYPSTELICVSAEEKPSTAFLAFLGENREMGLSALCKTKENQERLAKIAPFIKEYPIPEKGESYYLCRGQHCFAPQKNLKELHRLMEENV
ncbi:thioredoxin domain-containing protein [Anaerotignum sp.]